MKFVSKGSFSYLKTQFFQFNSINLYSHQEKGGVKLNIERLKRVYSALCMHCLHARCTGLKVTIITSLIMFIEDINYAQNYTRIECGELACV